MPFKKAFEWGKGAFDDIAHTITGTPKGVQQVATPDYSAYQYQVGEDPTERALLQQGYGLTRGLQQDYGDVPQIRLAGEGDPRQLANARRRRSAQYEAAGLPSVGFDPGEAGAMRDSARPTGRLSDDTPRTGLMRFAGEGRGRTRPEPGRSPSPWGESGEVDRGPSHAAKARDVQKIKSVDRKKGG